MKTKKQLDAEYYIRHKDKIIKRVCDYNKRTHYRNEKSPHQRHIRNIKRWTRYYFPLTGHLCEVCGNNATERHHNTTPIEFDKFNFVCHDCHNRIHKEVKK